MKRTFGAVALIVVLSLLISACAGPIALTAPPTVKPQANALTSIPVQSPPVLDGSGGDLAWQAAPARVLQADSEGIKPFPVTIKSVYDKENVYFLVQYPDLNKDVNRSPWAYNADKKAWERLGDDLGDEDEFGFYWNVNVPNYNVNGCKDFCHNEDPSNQRMWTPKGTWVDIWGWNAARTDPMGWARDMRLTDDQNASDKGGFVEDEGFKTRTGFDDNVQKLGNLELPLYWKPFSGVGSNTVAGDPLFILQSEIDAGYARKIVKLNSDGTLLDEAGNSVPIIARIPGRIMAAPAGPSWSDIKARGGWLNGVWSVEISRKLNTGHADDIQFDTGKEYYFDLYYKTRQVGEKDRETVNVSKFLFGK